MVVLPALAADFARSRGIRQGPGTHQQHPADRVEQGAAPPASDGTVFCLSGHSLFYTDGTSRSGMTRLCSAVRHGSAWAANDDASDRLSRNPAEGMAPSAPAGGANVSEVLRCVESEVLHCVELGLVLVRVSAAALKSRAGDSSCCTTRAGIAFSRVRFPDHAPHHREMRDSNDLHYCDADVPRRGH
jgi:hypothetical protein